MQFKKITLCGFKSFADQTEFEFGSGITAVVGPNGCGKSNIVDAVRWVLGEQSAKSLRGGHMQDVIFNGTSLRKSTGVCEVKLHFSNPQGVLDSDLDEIVVTRKLYRSGESEYLLNNKACRLKDIRQLFMGSGVGADTYSIIEQGKVDTLLQSNPQDRRAIFEEAAGISRYKQQKREAMRKLERTEQNVLRIQDIISELEKRLRSIKLQAGKARNFQAYSERLKELRLEQFLTERYDLHVRNQKLQESLAGRQDQLVEITVQTEKSQSRLSVLGHEMESVRQEIRQLENQSLQCTSQIANHEDRMELGHRRRKELAEAVEKNRRRIQVLRQQQEQIGRELEEGREALESVRQELAGHQEKLKQRQDLLQEKSLLLNEHSRGLEDEKSGLIDIVRRTAQLHNEINTLDLKQNTLTGQKTRLSDRSGKIQEELRGLLTRQAQYSEKLQEIEQLLSDSQGQLERKRGQLGELNEQQLVCSEKLSSAKEYRSGLISRQQILEDMEKNLEGVDQGVKQIVQEKGGDSGAFYYIRGMVADLLQAQVDYAGLVEASLAENAQLLVGTNWQAVLEDQERLDELKGRVRILCLDQLKPYSNGFDFSPYEQVKGRLIDFVHYPEDCKGLAWQLLGHTMIVETLEDAMTMARIAPPEYRWVTLSGDVLESDGTIHLGPAMGPVGLISRKSELRQLQGSLAEVGERIETLQNQSQQYTQQAQHLEKNLQELRTAIYETNTEKIGTRGQLEQIGENVARLKREEPLIATEIEQIESQIHQALDQQRTSEKNLSDLETVNQRRQEEIDRLEGLIESLTAQQQEEVDAITELKVLMGRLQQKQLAMQERIQSLQTQVQQDQHQIGNLQQDLAVDQEHIVQTERSILESESAITDLFQSRQERQTQKRQKDEHLQQMNEEYQNLSENVSRLRSQHEEIQEQVHELQMKRSENQLRKENLIQRSREELELDLEERFADYEKPSEEIDLQAAGQEIEELKQKIRRLGNINLEAITEQEELEQRLTYLQNQYDDLSQARKQLTELIETINQESTQLFLTNFQAISQNFSELFRKLFGGGRAEIMLENPEDVLECGIEIIARPPGKQPQSISLLSGGEKTMTAVALLMAIFKTKPSPFCLLDEVDAALDEANIERFTFLVQEFLEYSQFIIITHSRRTMAIADVIYGITMQEQGVSNKVSVRFSHDDETVETGTAVA